MTKICFSHYERGQFKSLQKAIQFLKREPSSLSIYLLKIVQHNICYREVLRESGIDVLINLLIQEAPELVDDQEALDEVRKWWQEEEKLAPYDIQCYAITDSVMILDHLFHGLQSVDARVEICGSDSLFGIQAFTPVKAKPLPDIHVAELYENYPKFDSFDWADDRTYRNYFFSRNPITAEKLNMIHKFPHGSNYCMVHERLPLELLPVLYYQGDGNYMFLASRKE